MTHDDKRNGTIDLFAAMNLATGEVLHDTRRRHAGVDVLAFFKLIDLHVPRHLDVHVVVARQRGDDGHHPRIQRSQSGRG